ncbi:hypothetical protein NQS96_13070 [Pseudoalteromonas shioyasakiensis]|uniref:hypothetical protein n=1 Tax=Pseudoalteromonas shioyasakiensis TaxID=1190813 RepID=UPI0021191876|nr:hypothetical protein [Pseudoalteromonas shioyasakiensis]MCQ8882705.1 hypothetical protein [Pseudoalteromonas shioyasakiensis]
MGTLVIKIIKVFLLLLVSGALIFRAYLWYLEYEKSQKLKAELSYNSEHEWLWHDEYSRIQIRYVDAIGRSILRKVYKSDDHVIYAYKNDDYSLSAVVLFYVPCEPESEIITSQEFASGKPKTLVCNPDGEALSFSVTWSDKSSDKVWNEQLDGFSLRVDFSDWDFTKLDQEITLSKAKPKNIASKPIKQD